MVTADVQLQVKLPPTMVDEPLTRSVRAKVGESTQLTCKAEGFPKPGITWGRADGHVLPSGRENVTKLRLTIPKVRMEDRGSCEA